MKITRIDLIPDDESLVAKFTLEPTGSMTLRLRRNSGVIWLNKKAAGDAHMVFYTRPDGARYYKDDVEALVQEIRQRELLRIGPTGQLVFDRGFEVQPSVELDPRDLLDNSNDLMDYSSDVPIPGIQNKTS